MKGNKSVAPMRAAKTGYIIISAVCCILGLLLIIFPDISVSVIGVTLGIMMIIFGAVKLIGYFSKDLYRLAFQYDLAFGLLIIALGIIVLFKSNHVMHFICAVLGISILADGLFKVQISIEAKKFGIKPWWLILTTAIIAGIIGLLLILKPYESSKFLIVLMGISLLVEGLLNLCTVLTAVKIIKHQKPDDYDDVIDI